MKKVSKVRSILVYLHLLVGTFISLIPFYWVAIAATNESGKVFAKPLVLIPGGKLLINIANLNEAIFYSVCF